jgi:hypothetical protein
MKIVDKICYSLTFNRTDVKLGSQLLRYFVHSQSNVFMISFT